MLKLLSYLMGGKKATAKALFPQLPEEVRGLPMLTGVGSFEPECAQAVEGCPTGALRFVSDDNGEQFIELDRGACISCGFCLTECPTAAIANDRSTKVACRERNELISRAPLTVPDGVKLDENNNNGSGQNVATESSAAATSMSANSRIVSTGLGTPVALPKVFERSIAVRVVSTGCASCDLEIGAAGNPVFDMERFGVHVVASPRFADVLLVTGPVPKAMHEALRICYDAMPEPKAVVAVGSCAISGGIHKDGYTQANGVGAILPVDVFVPGCPPHPWSIIHGIALAMGRKLTG